MVSRKESSKKIFLLVIIVSIFMLMCLSTNVKAESSQMQVGYVDVKSGLRVRSEASTKSEIIGHLKPGNLVEIMKKEGFDENLNRIVSEPANKEFFTSLSNRGNV